MWKLSLMEKLAVVMVVLGGSYAAEHRVYWNSSATVKTSSLDVELKDRILFYCPHYAETVTEEETEKSILYMVEESDAAACRLGPRPRAIGQCRSPFLPLTLALVIRSFTPLPSAPEFKPGHTYHIISTSTGSLDGLHNQVGGLCQSGLKLRLRVQELEPKPHPNSLAAEHENKELPLDREVTRGALDLKPDTESSKGSLLDKLSPKSAPGRWWNPKSAPDYVPLPPAAARNLDGDTNALYRVAEYSNKEARKAGASPWAQRDDPTPRLQSPLLFQVEEVPWTEEGYSSGSRSVSSLLLLSYTLSLLLISLS